MHSGALPGATPDPSAIDLTRASALRTNQLPNRHPRRSQGAYAEHVSIRAGCRGLEHSVTLTARANLATWLGRRGLFRTDNKRPTAGRASLARGSRGRSRFSFVHHVSVPARCRRGRIPPPGGVGDGGRWPGWNVAAARGAPSPPLPGYWPDTGVHQVARTLRTAAWSAGRGRSSGGRGGEQWSGAAGPPMRRVPSGLVRCDGPIQACVVAGRTDGTCPQLVQEESTGERRGTVSSPHKASS